MCTKKTEEDYLPVPFKSFQSCPWAHIKWHWMTYFKRIKPLSIAVTGNTSSIWMKCTLILTTKESFNSLNIKAVPLAGILKAQITAFATVPEALGNDRCMLLDWGQDSSLRKVWSSCLGLLCFNGERDTHASMQKVIWIKVFVKEKNCSKEKLIFLYWI